MTTPHTSLSNATSGTGSAADFEVSRSNISMIVIPTGTILAGVVTLDISQDGSAWVPYATSVSLLSGANQIISANGVAVRYARGRITTAITGGGSITCTIMEAN